MQHKRLTTAIVLALALSQWPAAAQKLHVNPRWAECAFQIDPSLTQAAWHRFTREAGLVVLFRPLDDARPLGKAKFELSALRWQSNIDASASAWNDTFVHPDSTHWLTEGNGLEIPASRFGQESTRKPTSRCTRPRTRMRTTASSAGRSAARSSATQPAHGMRRPVRVS